ncbi:MAG: acyl-CoA dehydrogenase family protein [Acidimicrobiia bacterium]|nr:acyl-CoA dehydrogenase family protein [Acidimicrobiia bacterium]
MDPRYPPAAETFRERVRAFLAEHLPSGWRGIGALGDDEGRDFLASWRRTLHEHRLLAVSWPEEYGGAGLTKIEQVVLAEELARAGVPSGDPSDTFGIKMVGNTLLRWGTEEQRRRFLPRILSGEDRWCQGFSEPDAGSDLASLATRASLVDGHWVLNGQKIWTSRAQHANWMFLLARTDPDAPRHRGITFLLCPMDQAGVEVRPIRMLNGGDDFNEVFLTDARTAAENVVGEVDGGWAVAMTLLGHERGEEAAINPILFRDELDRLVRLARERGKDRDPVVRDRLAWCYMKVETMRFLGYRILSRYLRDGTLGAEASISKLYWSEYHQRLSELAMAILGPHGLVPSGRRPIRPYRTDDPGVPDSSASWANIFLLNARAGTVYAGTSQVQRNILGETVLGLPKEPRETHDAR